MRIYSNLYLSALLNHSSKAVPVAASRSLYVSSKCSLIYEPSRKGDIKYDRKTPTFTKENVSEAFRRFLPEFGKWKEEVKDKFRGDNFLPVPENVVDVFTRFNGPESLKECLVSCDSSYDEGFSTAQVTTSSLGYAVFSGNLSTQLPKDGRIKATGYCNLRFPKLYKSFMRPIPYPLEMYTHLVLRVRGDGRSYVVNMHTPGDGDVTWFDIFCYPLFTRGGPYWQLTKIPFSKFVQQYKGRVQVHQHCLPRDMVKAISISIADNNNGPFHLEIDYIGAEKIGDPDPEETFYESYDLPVNIIY